MYEVKYKQLEYLPALWYSTVPLPMGPIKDEGRREMEVIAIPRGETWIWRDQPIPVHGPTYIDLYFIAHCMMMVHTIRVHSKP